VLVTIIITVTIVASAAVPVAIALSNNNDHPHDAHDVNNCIHNGHTKSIIDDHPPMFSFLSNNNKGNAFPTMHAL
jgi:hypothetical protein